MSSISIRYEAWIKNLLLCKSSGESVSTSMGKPNRIRALGSFLNNLCVCLVCVCKSRQTLMCESTALPNRHNRRTAEKELCQLPFRNLCFGELLPRSQSHGRSCHKTIPGPLCLSAMIMEWVERRNETDENEMDSIQGLFKKCTRRVMMKIPTIEPEG